MAKGDVDTLKFVKFKHMQNVKHFFLLKTIFNMFEIRIKKDYQDHDIILSFPHVLTCIPSRY